MFPYIFTDLGNLDFGFKKKIEAMAVNIPYDPEDIKEQLKEEFDKKVEQIAFDITDHAVKNKFKKAMESIWERVNPLELHSKKSWDVFLSTTNKLYDTLIGFYIRKVFIELFSFSIPSKESLEEIKEFVGNQVVSEYMSGTGYWAYLMNKAGIKTIPSDIPMGIGGVDTDVYPLSKARNFMNLEIQDVMSVEVDPNRVIMMSWIPLGSNIGDNILGQMVAGQKLILVGEEKGGCTGTRSTFCMIDEYFDKIRDISIPRFVGLNDRISLYIRNSKESEVFFDPTDNFWHSNLGWHSYSSLYEWDAKDNINNDYQININKDKSSKLRINYGEEIEFGDYKEAIEYAEIHSAENQLKLKK